MYNNNYEEIKTFLPAFYEDIVEMQAILTSGGNQLDEVERNLNTVLLNNFIMYADEPTITKFEKFLYLQVKKTKPLDERKRLVASFFIGFGKMSASKIKDIVYAFTEATSNIFFEDSTISIEIERGTSSSLYLIDLNTILERRLPAHLLFLLIVKYTIEIIVCAKIKAYKFGYPLTNTLKCGTYPKSSTLGRLENVEINLSSEISNYEFNYKLCGTSPNIATLGVISVSDINTGTKLVNYTFNYILCGTKRCGE